MTRQREKYVKRILGKKTTTGKEHHRLALSPTLERGVVDGWYAIRNSEKRNAENTEIIYIYIYLAEMCSPFFSKWIKIKR